ncbi:MAG: helix-hairpin-helix domain-containing protein [Chloroflexia bacterium]|nr:helix-hairpin-helix domain-containing protein [Chloroflexia bacterium]
MAQLLRYRWPITIGLILLAALGGYWLCWPAAPVYPTPLAAILVYTPTAPPSPTPAPSATPAPLFVYVSGAVLRPGVYALPAGARVVDALEAAGGPTTEADLVYLNLARRVRDEEQIHVPRRGEPTPNLPPPPPAAGASVPPEQPAKVNINTAGLAELDGLPGIGPSYAQRIIDYRSSHGPFQTIEEIQNVPGIGPSTFARIQSLITVGP